MSADKPIPDLLEVEIPIGGRVLVAADLHLTPEPPAATAAALGELASTIEASTGPGALILAGNVFETLDGGADAAAALAAHPRLADDLATYAAGEGRRLIVLPGARDVKLASLGPAREVVSGRLGAELALAVDLVVHTGAGPRRIRVEPGYRFDPLSSYRDARNPLESPYAQHVRDQVLPAVKGKTSGGGWVAGVEDLDDLGALSRFIASRLVYRRLVRSGWLLLLPIVAAFILRLPEQALRSARHGALGTRLGLFVAAAFLELLILVLIGILAIRVTSRALGAVALEDARGDPNERSRASARELVTAGYAGLITGHTCRAELIPLGQGFYANAGAGADVVTEYPTRLPGLGLPSVFLPHRILSWVEVEAGSDLHARLLHARRDLPGSTLLEKLAARRDGPSSSGELRPEVVASFPHGAAWPRPDPTSQRDRRVRRVAAAVLVLVGFLSLVSAMSDPVSDRLQVVRRLFPLSVPETAAAITAFVGVALIVLARGIRRGQRRAWVVCELLLLAVAVLHLIKGVDVEESLIALGAASGLYVYRGSFQARTDVVAMRRGLLTVLGAAVLVVAAGTLGVEISTVIDHSRHHAQLRVSWIHALQASLYRMVGSGRIPLPHRINDFLAPAMATAAAGLLLALLAVLFRPVVSRRLGSGTLPRPPAGRVPARGIAAGGVAAPTAGADTSEASVAHGPEGLGRARAVMERHGSGTLDFFALRPDKDFFFWGDTVVAHAVYGGVCLVSPDPIGPVAEREAAWRAFRRYSDVHGWVLGGLGMGEDWLPIYRATGMHDLYVGDEAVVRVNRFTLEGGRFKGLRQAVNRVAKYGYRITFHDPAALDPALRDQLREVMTKSRRGDVERGFSMTLGRVFDPADVGLLLAVVHGPVPEGAVPEGAVPEGGVPEGGVPEGGVPDGPVPEGAVLGPPVAFCQYVPAPGIGGYSLDLMRRDDGEHPNGLIDFAVVETIRELRSRGREGLGLNFATMRAVLAGEAGEGLSLRVQAWLLRRMGGSMQIESLWKFNAKFDPDWQPRYAVYDAPENALAVALAVARAESFWELPVIGRFLVPAASAEGSGAGSGAG